MSQLDEFDGAKIIDARAKRHVAAAADLLRTEMKADFEELRAALAEVRGNAASSSQNQSAIASAEERLALVETKLMTFLGDEEEEHFEYSGGDGEPRPTPEILSARIDYLEGKLNNMAQAPQPEPDAAGPPSSGGFSTWVTHAALSEETAGLIRRDEIDGLKNELLAEVRRIVADAGQIADQATLTAPDAFADVSEFTEPAAAGSRFPGLRGRRR